jgi:hypothetical protein
MKTDTKDSIATITSNTPIGEGGSVVMAPYIQTYPYPGVSVDNTKVYKKLLAVLKEGITVGKSGWNNFHKYHYTTEADVVEGIRSAFVKHGLIYQFDMISTQQVTPEVVRAAIRFSLIDPDSGQRIDSVVYGDGQDKGDKGVFKAITGAQKYFLMKTFLLSTGDDPENDSAAPNEPKKTTTAVNKPAPAPKTAPIAATSTNSAPTRSSFNRSAFKSNPAPAKETPSEVQPESEQDVEY